MNSIYTIKFKSKKVAYKVKIQKVERGKTKSFYVNFPAAVAEACTLSKGEEMEWLIEDRNIFVLRRVTEAKSVVPKTKTDK